MGKGLERKGIRLLGVIPEMDLLSAPTVEQIEDRLDLKVFSGEENLRKFRFMMPFAGGHGAVLI